MNLHSYANQHSMMKRVLNVNYRPPVCTACHQQVVHLLRHKTTNKVIWRICATVTVVPLIDHHARKTKSQDRKWSTHMKSRIRQHLRPASQCVASSHFVHLSVIVNNSIDASHHWSVLKFLLCRSLFHQLSLTITS